MPKKKRTSSQQIYWLHPHFYNWMGGHKYILEVTQRLKNEYGYDVTIVTSGISASARKKFAQVDIPVLSLFRFSTNSMFYWFFLSFFVSAESLYLKYFKRLNPQAIYISSMFPSNDLSTTLSKRTVQMCYEPFAFFYDEEFIHGFSFLQRIFIFFITFLYRDMDRDAVLDMKKVLTISEFNKKWIEKAYGRKDVAVTYEGVDTTFFYRRSSSRLKKKYHNKAVIFHSTDYTSIKGTEYLLKALPEVMKKVKSVQVVISETLPNSPAKAAIVELVNELKLEKAIEFAGFLPYEELPEYLSMAKVVVQPSINQSMNLTVKEAMACGTAIITSPEGKEQTEDGKAGFLVDPKNTKLLAQRIIECLKKDQMTRKMGQSGQKIIQQKFTWDVVTKKIVQELQKV